MPASPPKAESRGSEDDESSSSADEETEHQVESLVAGRAKRATAGNRLSSLLVEGDDELELLFAEEEGEEDVEFEGQDTDGVSDVPLDSSTDEEDNDAAKAADEWDGERELQKQNRTERQKKRKAHDIFKQPTALRKKMMIGPAKIAVPRTPAARPRKKSERVSWIPTPEDGPTRSSTRKQTVQNKQSVHLRMVESEKRRLQLIHVMEEAAKRKEASKPKHMTQAERMEEAARTEERNAKSLNRWEETEKKRSDEQKAKLEALQNRHLSGPVITWWSGMATWVNGKLTQVGSRGVKEAHDGVVAAGDTVTKSSGEVPGHNETSVREQVGSPSRPPASSKADQLPPQPIHSFQSAATPGSTGLEDGVRHHVSGPGEPHHFETPGQVFHIPRVVPSNSRNSDVPPRKQSPKAASVHYPELSLAGDLPTTMVDYSTRNLMILDNIDVNDMRRPELQNHILLKKRNVKPQRKFT